MLTPHARALAIVAEDCAHLADHRQAAIAAAIEAAIVEAVTAERTVGNRHIARICRRWNAAERKLEKIRAARAGAIDALEPWRCHQCGGPITDVVAASHGWYCSQGCRDAAEGCKS